jgi:predicted Rossmann fold flavoprotein
MPETTSVYDIAVIGAGAAGLTAAIFAGLTAPDVRVVALDGARRIGAKILISGGGRCNVTNEALTPEDFNGNRNTIGKVLRTFPVEETIAWFREMGVTLEREERGKLFPTTNRAQTVLDALLFAARKTEIVTGCRVEEILPRDGRFIVETTAEPYIARRVILSTGGQSVPKTGSDGGGYVIARALGHEVTEVFPALVPLVIESGHWATSLSGTSAGVELAVRTPSGRVITRQRGAMLFTHFGISGPVALDISRHWITAQRLEGRGVLTVNFLPGETFQSAEKLLLDQMNRNPRASLASALRGRLPERLLTAVGGGESLPLSAMGRSQRRQIVHSLVALPLPVVRDRGFDYAEVTAGGVPLTEIVPSTMASRRCDGLFLCGEILDVDGRIGGFNFQWAWASGRLAGIHAARSLHT